MDSTHPRRPAAARSLALATVVFLSLTVACGDGGLTPIELPVDSLELVDGCEFMTAGESCQVVVNAFTADGQRISNPILRFQTTTPNVLNVTEDGLVTARVAGRGFVLVQSSTGSARLQLDILVTNPNPRNEGES